MMRMSFIGFLIAAASCSGADPNNSPDNNGTQVTNNGVQENNGSTNNGEGTNNAQATNNASALCNNDCSTANDGDCDDGGPDAAFDSCSIGSDCADCGERTIEEACTLCGDAIGFVDLWCPSDSEALYVAYWDDCICGACSVSCGDSEYCSFDAGSVSTDCQNCINSTCSAEASACEADVLE